MKKIHLIMLISSLILLFLSGSLYTTHEWRFIQPYLLIGSISFLFSLIIVLKIKTIYIDYNSLLIFLLYIFFSLLSSFVNADLELMTGALLILYIYIVLVIFLPVIINVVSKHSERIIVLSILIGHLPILSIPMFIDGYRTSSYSGIFYNPNAFGVVVATLFVVVFSRIVSIIEGYTEGDSVSKKEFILYAFLTLFIIILIAYSSSRTSFLSVGFVSFINMILLFSNTVRNKTIKLKYLKKMIILFFVISAIILTMYLFTPIGDILYEGIFSKFEHKSDDLLDGRSIIWNTTINEWTFLGHGRDYFSTIGGGAHNTFISILGQYGLIPLLFFISFNISTLFKNLKYFNNSCNNELKYLSISSILLFILLSMGEGMMLKTSMLLAFCMAGLVNKEINKSPKRN